MLNMKLITTLILLEFFLVEIKAMNDVLGSEAVEYRTQPWEVLGSNLAMTHQNFCNQYLRLNVACGAYDT